MKFKFTSNIRFVFKNIWEVDKTLAIAAVLSIPVTLLLAVIDLVMPAAIVREFESANTALLQVILIIAGFLLIRWILSIISNKLDSKKYVSEHKLVLHYLSLLYKKNLDIDYAHLEDPRTKIMAERADAAVSNNHTEAIHVPNSFAQLLIALLKFALFGSLIFILNPLIIAGLLIAAGLQYLTILYSNHYENKTKDERVAVSRKLDYLSRISENFRFGKDIRIYGLGKWISDLSKMFFKEHFSLFNKLARRKILSVFIDLIVILARDGLAYWYLISFTINGEISVAGFILYFAAISQFVNILGDLLNNFSALTRGNYQIRDLRKYLEIEDKLNRNIGVTISSEKPTIEFRNVEYSYPGADEPTLKNINLTIHAGKKMAIVGLNGAGKTTLVKLICGMYVPTKGEILIDGHSVFEYNRDDYYRLFSVVFQKFHLLPLSIEKNIACDNINELKLAACIKQAGLSDKLASLPAGAKTLLVQEVFPNAIELSGGEKQKLILTRALYKDAPVLILDEPTASLDPIAEKNMYLKYNSMTLDKTSIFISHRLASTRFCDEILYMENGEIIETGSHNELIKQNGKYSELFSIQGHYYHAESNAELI